MALLHDLLGYGSHCLVLQPLGPQEVSKDT